MKYKPEDILLDSLTGDIVEDEYFEVVKILGDVRTQSLNYVKRVQLVKWKKKKIVHLHIKILKQGLIKTY